MKISKDIRGHLAAIATIIIWGISFISTKILLNFISPFKLLLYRLILSVCALIIFSPPKNFFGKINRAKLRDESKYMFAGLFGVTLYYIFQNLALEQTYAANVSVLISTSPLFIALFGKAFLNQKLEKNFLLGFLISIIGIVIVTFNGSAILRINPVGDLLSVCAALAWAVYCILIRKIDAQGKKVLKLTRKVFTYGLFFMLFLILTFDISADIDQMFEYSTIQHLLFLGLVGSAFCFVSWNYAVNVLGPVKSSVYLYGIPFVTIIASRLALNEKITIISFLGMVLILIGVIISEKKTTENKFG